MRNKEKRQILREREREGKENRLYNLVSKLSVHGQLSC